IQVRWYKPGFGGYRPVGVCQCGRTAFRFYKLHQKLYCKKCCGGLYASQAGDTTSRPHIALTRLKSFISSLPKRTFAQTYRRLEAKHKALEAKLPPGYSLHSKRIPENVLRPKGRYRVRSAGAISMAQVS